MNTHDIDLAIARAEGRLEALRELRGLLGEARHEHPEPQPERPAPPRQPPLNGHPQPRPKPLDLVDDDDEEEDEAPPVTAHERRIQTHEARVGRELPPDVRAAAERSRAGAATAKTAEKLGAHSREAGRQRRLAMAKALLKHGPTHYTKLSGLVGTGSENIRVTAKKCPEWFEFDADHKVHLTTAGHQAAKGEGDAPDE